MRTGCPSTWVKRSQMQKEPSGMLHKISNSHYHATFLPLSTLYDTASSIASRQGVASESCRIFAPPV